MIIEFPIRAVLLDIFDKHKTVEDGVSFYTPDIWNFYNHPTLETGIHQTNISVLSAI